MSVGPGQSVVGATIRAWRLDARSGVPGGTGGVVDRRPRIRDEARPGEGPLRGRVEDEVAVSVSNEPIRTYDSLYFRDWHCQPLGRRSAYVDAKADDFADTLEGPRPEPSGSGD